MMGKVSVYVNSIPVPAATFPVVVPKYRPVGGITVNITTWKRPRSRIGRLWKRVMTTFTEKPAPVGDYVTIIYETSAF